MSGAPRNHEGRKNVSRDPGAIEYLFPLDAPRPTAMAHVPALGLREDDWLYAGDTELSATTPMLIVRAGRDGALDPAFGEQSQGSVVAYLDLAGGVLAGLISRPGGGVIAVVRTNINYPLEAGLVGLTASGELDSSFGDGSGKIIHPIPGPPATDVAAPHRSGCAERGAFVVHGAVASASAPADERFYCLIASPGPYYALLRCLPNGRLDPTFADGGCKTEGDWFDNEWGAYDMVAHPDGRVTLVGVFVDHENPRRVALWRLHADGSLDTTFGDGGRAFFEADAMDLDGDTFVAMDLVGLELLSNGDLVACGNVEATTPTGARRRFGVVGCFDSSGAPLASFHGGKFALLKRIDDDVGFVDVGIQRGGESGDRIVVGGVIGTYDERNILVARFATTGRLDGTFGNDGIVKVSGGFGPVNRMTTLFVDAAGKILGAGAGGPDNTVGRMTSFVFQMST